MPDQKIDETPFVPPTSSKSFVPGNPSPQAQQWGAVISIIIIVLMIIIGAFYSWGKRISEQESLKSTTTAQ